ncbi:unnamed protein product [Owenia fusiformis]|uniref:Uncharacterized protein n=1 Tax=Owenia fusiformis TaxID=6347 RepID=A0A8J1XNW7_OWEFU|nr:unnamed protein product [Owenia fusiformis]
MAANITVANPTSPDLFTKFFIGRVRRAESKAVRKHEKRKTISENSTTTNVNLFPFGRDAVTEQSTTNSEQNTGMSGNRSSAFGMAHRNNADTGHSNNGPPSVFQPKQCPPAKVFMRHMTILMKMLGSLFAVIAIATPHWRVDIHKINSNNTEVTRQYGVWKWTFCHKQLNVSGGPEVCSDMGYEWDAPEEQYFKNWTTAVKVFTTVAMIGFLIAMIVGLLTLCIKDKFVAIFWSTIAWFAGGNFMFLGTLIFAYRIYDATKSTSTNTGYYGYSLAMATVSIILALIGAIIGLIEIQVHFFREREKVMKGRLADAYAGSSGDR